MGNDKIFELLDNSQYLPDMPGNLSEILDIIMNPVGLNIDLLAKKVSQSKELNEFLLNNINTGYFQMHKKIESIKEAIIYLGMQTVQNLLIFSITLQLFQKTTGKSSRTFNMRHYWKHVLGTSVASSILSTQLNKGDKYRLFTYGLIHDIGIVVLDSCLPELIDEITKMLLNGVHQLIAERIVLDGITHADIGAWLCRRWNIDNEITNIVEYHHTPFLTQTHIEEVQIVYVADVISTEYYEKLLGVNLNHNINRRVIESLGMTDEDMKVVMKAFPSEVEKAIQYFAKLDY